MGKQLCVAWVFLAALLAFASPAAADPVNPCRKAAAQCRAGDRFLTVTYTIDLHNPSDASADVLLLPSVDILEKVEGARRGLTVNRIGSALWVSTPAQWKGRIVVTAKQRIERAQAGSAFSTKLSMPPAVARAIEFDLPGRNVKLKVSPEAIIRALKTPGDRSRFRVLPLEGDLFAIEWQRVPPARSPRYALRQVHRIFERAPGFRDDVTLTFSFSDTLPRLVSATIPAGVHAERITAPAGVRWRLMKRTLEVFVPKDLAGKQLTVTCRLEGTARPAGGEAHLLDAPIFAAPGAQRVEGRVLLGGGVHELSFTVLKGAVQSAAESADGKSWKLACDFRGVGAKVAVKIVPMAPRRHAAIQSHYHVSDYRVSGMHRILVRCPVQPLASVELGLGEGQIVRTLTGQRMKSWVQRGRKVIIETAIPAGGQAGFELATERLIRSDRAATTVRQGLSLDPLTVAGMTSRECSVRIAVAPNVLLKPTGKAEAWRTRVDGLPEWLRGRSGAIAYRFGEALVPVELDVLPIVAQIRGTVQDHVTVLEDRIRRETLFALDVEKRSLDAVTVLLPPGLTVDDVGGPHIEDWGVAEGNELTIRFKSALTGAVHFQLTSGRAIKPGRLTLRAIRLRAAPGLKGWLGISTDVSLSVRPMEDGQMALNSVRTNQAPPYLKSFDNKLLYELYGGDWKLALLHEDIPPVYTADVLNVLRFRASQVRATALFNINVTQGGVGTLQFELPANASGSLLSAPDVVQAELKDRTWHVRFRGKRTGSLHCRVDYDVVAPAGKAQLEVEPVRLLGARGQTGLVLLTQTRPDVEVKVGALPRALTPAESGEQYGNWSYTRREPAVAAFTYRGIDWKLPLTAEGLPLSQVMLRASIPLAKLDTMVRGGSETLNHLRLYVANTNKQFLSIDMARLGDGARLIGTYVYGKPVKPFRGDKGKLQLPLLESEEAARFGMSVIDITYSLPPASMMPLRKQSLTVPDLGLNVGHLEWVLRLPDGSRMFAVGGNVDAPVSPPPAVKSLAGRLLWPIWRFIAKYWHVAAWVLGFAAVCMALYYGFRWSDRRTEKTRLRRILSPIVQTAAVIAIVAVVAALLMPALATSSMDVARGSDQRGDLHNVALGLRQYMAANNGETPASLQELVEPGYLYELDDLEWPGQELVYRRLKRDAPPEAVMAYVWPPTHGGVNVLYNDGSVSFVRLTQDGRLVNPRTDKLVAVATPDEVRAAGEMAFSKFKVSKDEMSQALDLQAEMAPKGAAAPAEFARARDALATLEPKNERIPGTEDDYLYEELAQAVVPVPDPRRPGPAELPAKYDDDREGGRKDMSRSRLNLGLEYNRRGDYLRAQDQFARALELDKDNKAARQEQSKTEALLAQAGKPSDNKPLDYESKLALREKEWVALATKKAQQRPSTQVLDADPRVTTVALRTLPKRGPRKSLVRRVGGGRTVGALPIEIDFPVPATTPYEFVKPLLGRTRATVSFRTVARRPAMLIELVLAVGAMLALLAIKYKRPAGAIGFAGAAFAVALALSLTAAPPVAVLFASTALAMGACFAAEALSSWITSLRKPKPQEI